MKELIINLEQKLIMDKDTYDFIKDKKIEFNIKGYPYIILHRMFFSNIKSNKKIIDHINRDRLDFRRSNLRAITHRQNSANTKKMNIPTSSIYKCVSFCKKLKKWRLTIYEKRKKKKALICKFFNTEIEAAIAHDIFVLYYRGEYAYLNFDKEKYKNLNLKEEFYKIYNRKRLNNTLGYTGISKTRSKFFSRYKEKNIGSFKTKEEAAQAYDKKLIEDGKEPINFSKEFYGS